MTPQIDSVTEPGFENPADTQPSLLVSGETCVTLEDARREILRLVCLDSAAITQAIIKDALQGRYLSAKFLFEAVGLLAMDAEDLENPDRKESLASLLLQRWEVVPQGDCVTEVSEVAPFVAPVDEAPVEL